VSETNDPHLRDDVLAAYLDGALPAAERRIADDHLAECAACRDELVDISKLIADRGRVRRWPRLAASVAAVAAAAIAFAVVGPWRAVSGPSTDSGDRMRESTLVDGGNRREVVIVTPAEGDTVRPGTVRFTWHSLTSNATYLLKVADETSVRWKKDTADTTVALPDSVQLERGRSYTWWVDALTADGRVATTGVRQFRTSQ
jgi:putative zinc finger protein